MLFFRNIPISAKKQKRFRFQVTIPDNPNGKMDYKLDISEFIECKPTSVDAVDPFKHASNDWGDISYIVCTNVKSHLHRLSSCRRSLEGSACRQALSQPVRRSHASMQKRSNVQQHGATGDVYNRIAGVFEKTALSSITLVFSNRKR
ncbi:hypothetical protein PsorP6_015266 [Peronosclerospora sorghi]|uniref:Uncharacterized protein n=1 Tax=Peronosclerospora sorghi TaxID=230839 RepID=A0ACC0VT38_9STRA|nr:hypothetical protein PsorP6_015266 [Peronosclerospora sorghi]